MANTKSKSVKFSVGAIFLLIYLLWTTIELIDAVDMASYVPSYLEAYYFITAAKCFIFLGSIVTLCVFMFMKKSGLPLAISSFAVAFAVLIETIASIVLWLSLEDRGYVSSGSVFSYTFSAFVSFLLFYVFVAIGISSLLPKSRGLVKAMKISSLITAIVYVSLASLSFFINIFGYIGYVQAIQLVHLLFATMFYVGLLLTRGWIFRLIEATADACEAACADAGYDNDAECSVACTPEVSASLATVSVAPSLESVPTFVASAAPAPKAPATPAAKLTADEVAIQLRTYKLLLDDGIITAEEYDAKKKDVLGSV